MTRFLQQQVCVIGSLSQDELSPQKRSLMLKNRRAEAECKLFNKNGSVKHFLTEVGGKAAVKLAKQRQTVAIDYKCRHVKAPTSSELGHFLWKITDR